MWSGLACKDALFTRVKRVQWAKRERERKKSPHAGPRIYGTAASAFIISIGQVCNENGVEGHRYLLNALIFPLWFWRACGHLPTFCGVNNKLWPSFGVRFQWERGAFCGAKSRAQCMNAMICFGILGVPRDNFIRVKEKVYTCIPFLFLYLYVSLL